MVNFTDDDLKRLKEVTAQYRNLGSNTIMMGHDRVDALIARLKAAETLAHEKHFHEPKGFCYCKQCKAFDAWRKAAGK